MQIDYEIQLDIAKRNFVEIETRQYDDNSRRIKALIVKDGEQVVIPNGATINCEVKKPDGTYVKAVCSTITESDKTYIVIVLTQNMLAAYGQELIDIVLVHNSQTIGTMSFINRIRKAAVQDDDVMSTSEARELVEAMEEAEALKSDIEDAGGRLDSLETNLAAEAEARAAAVTAEAQARAEADTALGKDVTDLKSAITSLGTNEVSESITADMGTNIPYAITKGQTYVITIDLAIATRSVIIRTKHAASDATYVETLYSGSQVTNLFVTATADAQYLYVVSTSDADLNIKHLSPQYVYDVGKADVGSLYDTLYTNLELFAEMTKGFVVNTNQGVGNIVNPNSTTVNSQGAYGVFEVKQGDTFIITGIGGNAPRLWCFTDTSYKILSVANASISVSNLTIIAPANGYLIVNFLGILNPDNIYSLIKVHGRNEIEYINDSVDELTTKVFAYSGIDMFHTVACLGDSFTQGGMRNSTDTEWVTALKTYPKVLAARHGIVVTNYGYGGSTVKSYITDRLPTVLADSANDLYILSWGLNDAYKSMTVGTIADINDEDYTLNADTFYGNYGKIIAMLKETFPLARFVIFGPWLIGGIYKPYNTAAKFIAEHFGIGYCNPEDDKFFISSVWNNTLVGNHPTQVTYTGMAYGVERLLEKEITTNNLYYRYAGLETP